MSDRRGIFGGKVNDQKKSKPFRTKDFADKDDPTKHYHIVEENGKIEVQYDSGEVLKCQVVTKADSGYTIVRASDGKIFDYINKPDSPEHGKFGMLDEVVEMQTTGDVVTQRSHYDENGKITHKTYAFASIKDREGTQSGARAEISESEYNNFKEQHQNYERGEQEKQANNREFTDNVKKISASKRGEYIPIQFKDAIMDKQGENLNEYKYLSGIVEEQADNRIYEKVSETQSYTIFSEKGAKDWGKSIIKPKFGVDNMVQTLSYTELGDGNMIFYSYSNRDMDKFWNRTQRENESAENDGRMPILLTDDGLATGISEEEREEIGQMQVSRDQKNEKITQEITTEQLEFIEKNIPAKLRAKEGNERA